MQRKFFRQCAVGLFFIFLSFSLLLSLHNWTPINTRITIHLQSWIPRAVDPFFSTFSLLGSAEVLTLFLTIFLIQNTRLSLGTKLRFMGIYALGTLIELVGKLWLSHPGPNGEYFRYSIPYFFASSYVQTGHSYPSGHTFRSVFIACLVAYSVWESNNLSFSHKKLVFAVLAMGVGIMLISRVSLGEHWSTDVVGGTLLGTSLATWAIAKYWPDTPERAKQKTR